MIPDFTGTHLFDRLVWAQDHLDPVKCNLRCVYEDPAFPDAPVAVLIPTGEWMACALAGGILPPLSAYLNMPLELTFDDGEIINCTAVEAQDYRVNRNIENERVLPHHTLHTSRPIGPMTEQEAFTYLIKMCVPFRVWGRQHNRPMFRIITTKQLPQTRENRMAWRLSEMAA